MLEKGHGKWLKARFGELKTDLCAMEIIYYKNIDNSKSNTVTLIHHKQLAD